MKMPETKLVLKIKEKVEFKDQNGTLITRFIIQLYADLVVMSILNLENLNIFSDSENLLQMSNR